NAGIDAAAPSTVRLHESFRGRQTNVERSCGNADVPKAGVAQHAAQLVYIRKRKGHIQCRGADTKMARSGLEQGPILRMPFERLPHADGDATIVHEHSPHLRASPLHDRRRTADFADKLPDRTSRPATRAELHPLLATRLQRPPASAACVP